MKAVVMFLLLGGLLVAIYVGGYYGEPHPHAREVVQLRSEAIVTVDGVTSDGWLTECGTGTKRHVEGNYSIAVDRTPPVVCSNETHYREWVESVRRQADKDQAVKDQADKDQAFKDQVVKEQEAGGAGLAVLRNGTSIGYQRRQTLGPITRLYLDSGGYIEIPTDQIKRFEGATQ